MECFESAVPAIFLSYAPTFFSPNLKYVSSSTRLMGFDMNVSTPVLSVLQVKRCEVNNNCHGETIKEVMHFDLEVLSASVVKC